MNPDEFRSAFRRFRSSAWRLETLQQYKGSGEDERLRRFFAGEPYQPHAAKERWLSIIRDNLAAGRSMGRVHVVVEPLSDYVRYELTWGYGPNVGAGEDIRIIPATADTWPEGLRRCDFWLFDDQDFTSCATPTTGLGWGSSASANRLRLRQQTSNGMLLSPSPSRSGTTCADTRTC